MDLNSSPGASFKLDPSIFDPDSCHLYRCQWAHSTQTTGSKGFETPSLVVLILGGLGHVSSASQEQFVGIDDRQLTFESANHSIWRSDSKPLVGRNSEALCELRPMQSVGRFNVHSEEIEMSQESVHVASWGHFLAKRAFSANNGNGSDGSTMMKGGRKTFFYTLDHSVSLCASQRHSPSSVIVNCLSREA